MHPLDGALPQRHRAGRWLSRLRERRFERRMLRIVQRVCVPPPQRHWAHRGRAFIAPPARVTSPERITIGDGVVILENAWLSVVDRFPDVDCRLVIHDSVRIGRGCQFSVAGEVVVGERAIIGDFVQIGDTYHPAEPKDRMAALARPESVHIGEGAVIGSHAVVLPGVTIGAGAYIEHHSVVGRDVPPGVVVHGFPARARADA